MTAILKLESKVQLKRDPENWFGWFIYIDGFPAYYAYTKSGAKRIIRRLKNQEVIDL